jgi:pyruvate-formate lyase-activating enzyme
MQFNQAGISQGSCFIEIEQGKPLPRSNPEKTDHGFLRLISAVHLSRPENYLSIYQSGCNFSCRKCHSWSFTRIAKGDWWSPADILKACKEYEKEVTVWEPRYRATAFHAHDSCRCCGLV